MPLVAVQYPALPLASLAAMLDPGDVVFVDNEETFVAPLRRGRATEMFRDLLADEKPRPSASP